MITAIQLEGLRGIRSGRVEGLTPLSVLVGPNGCGKSTVLDGLLLGSAPAPQKAIAFVVRRRGTVEGGARWLFWRSGDRASITVTARADVARQCMLERRGASIECTVAMPSGTTKAAVLFSDDNVVLNDHGDSPDRFADVPHVRLVEPLHGADHEALHRVYTRALEEGRIEEVNALLRELLPQSFRRAEILAPKDKPVVYIVSTDQAVPAGLQGDGIQSLLRLGLELAAAPGGVVLIEEPEAAQHPRALYETARAIVAAVKRDVQVVLSTHNLDLIDMLRTHLDEDLDKLSVHHLACPDGALSVVRYSGPEVAMARDAIGEDLR